MTTRRFALPLAGAMALACQSPQHSDNLAAASGAVSASAPVAASAAPGSRPVDDLAPPIEPFAGLRPWQPPNKKAPAVTPPKTFLQPWRAFVNQTRPRQKKNPLWQPLPPDRAVTLGFDEAGPFRCLVNPLEIIPQPNDDNDGVAAWLLVRRLRCSSDGWRTWSETPHALIVQADGTERRPIEQSELFLKHRAGGKDVETVIWLRSDERRSRPPPPESEE